MIGIALLAATPTPSASAKSLHPDHLLRTQRIQTYGDWIAGCDGHGCTAIGIAGKGGAGSGVNLPLASLAVRLRWSVTGDTAPQVELLPLPPASGLPPPAGALQIDGLPELFEWQRQVLSPDRAAPFLGLLEQRGRLWVRAPRGGRAQAELPGGAGLQQLLPAIGGALKVQAGNRARHPAQQLTIHTGTETLVSGFLPLEPAGGCRQPRDVRQFVLAGDVRLYSLGCGPDSERRHLFLWQDKSRPAQELVLPEPRLGPFLAGRDGLPGAVLVLDYGMIAAHRFGGPGRDCGVRWTWGWTGHAWHLIERFEMPLCAGLGPKDWIATHHRPAKVIGNLPHD